MKTLILLLITATTFAQTSVNISGSKYSGQIEIERSEESFYYKAQAEYNHQEQFTNVGFGLGYNTAIDRFNIYKFHLGGKLGLISHTGQNVSGNATFGVETGVSAKLSDKISIGAKYVMDWREDLKFFGVNLEPSFKGNAFLILKFEL